MTSADQPHPRERFLFLGAGLLLLLAMLLGIAREQRWGSRYVSINMRASDVSGLNPGQEVRIAGFTVGEVGRMQLESNAMVTVQLKVDQSKANLIGPRSKARLDQEGLIGEPFVSISADPQPQADPQALDGKTISYQQPLDIADALEDLAETQQELQATLRNTTALTATDGNINTTLADLRNTLSLTNSLATSLEQEAEATAPVVRNSMNNVSREVRAVSNDAQELSQNAQALLQDSRPLINSTLKEVRELARTSRQLLNSVLGVLGPWLEPADGRNNVTPPAADSNAQYP